MSGKCVEIFILADKYRNIGQVFRLRQKAHYIVENPAGFIIRIAKLPKLDFMTTFTVFGNHIFSIGMFDYIFMEQIQQSIIRHFQQQFGRTVIFREVDDERIVFFAEIF